MVAQVEATEYQEIWHEFFVRWEQSAYRRDGRVTTHPIEVPVASTDDFYSVFDAITYDKGSSVLRQLSHFVGPENFRAGVSSYLKEHAYANTTLQDFVNSQAEASGRDLEAWVEQWLYQPGYNLLQPQIECGAGRISELSILQTGYGDASILREHRLDVALYSTDDNGLVLDAVYDVSIGGEVTVIPQAVGGACPDLVIPNFNDWAYAKVILDDLSIATAKKMVTTIADPFARSIVLQSLADGA